MAGRIAIVIPRSGTGPVVTPLHSAGVDGYTHRYVPARLGLAAGGDITSLPDLGTAGVPLTPTGFGTAKSQSSGGVTYAELTSSADTTANYVLQGATTAYAAQVTIAVVAQIPAAQVRIYETEAFGVVRATSGQFQAARTNGSGGSLLASGTNTWVFILAQVDAGASSLLLRTNATEATAALTSVQTGATAPRMGGNQGAASKVAQVAEAITWNRILSADERLAVQNAMKAKYSVLP